LYRVIFYHVFIKIFREFLAVARARVGWGKGNISFGGAFRFAKYGLQFRRNIRKNASVAPPKAGQASKPFPLKI